MVVLGWRRTGESSRGIAGHSGELRSTDIPSKSATRCEEEEEEERGYYCSQNKYASDNETRSSGEMSAAGARVWL